MGEGPECLLPLIAVLDGIKMQTSGRVFWLGSNFFVGVCSRQLGPVTCLPGGSVSVANAEAGFLIEGLCSDDEERV